MLSILHDWQELASGLLALLAGAFIFVQGRFDRRALREARREEAELEVERTNLILDRLRYACHALSEEIEGYLELLNDVFEAIDRDDLEVELPPKIAVPKIFETIFAQLTTRAVAIEIYLLLSALLERGIAIDDDFRRLLVAYSGTVTEHRPVQPRLPLHGNSGRRALDEPAAQSVILAVSALQEVSNELEKAIDAVFEGEKLHGRFVRSGVERVDPLQSFESSESQNSRYLG